MLNVRALRTQLLIHIYPLALRQKDLDEAFYVIGREIQIKTLKNIKTILKRFRGDLE
jgi:hypothetical protein